LAKKTDDNVSNKKQRGRPPIPKPSIPKVVLPLPADIINVATNIVALQDKPLLPTNNGDSTIVICDNGDYIPPVEPEVDDILEMDDVSTETNDNKNNKNTNNNNVNNNNLNTTHYATYQKFSNMEIQCLLDAIEEVVPVGKVMWDEVAVVYNNNTSQHQRSMENLRRKFNVLYSTRGGAGQTQIPPYVQRARTLKDLNWVHQSHVLSTWLLITMLIKTLTIHLFPQNKTIQLSYKP
jgi:hypothetical protein